MAQTWAQFANRCARLPGHVNPRMRPVLLEAGVVAQRIHRGVLARFVNGGRLRGVGRGGARVDIGMRPGVSGDSIVIHAKGALWLLDNDTAAHDVAPRRGTAMRIGESFVRGTVHVSGTHGKHTFRQGAIEAAPAVRQVIGRGVVKEVREALRG